MMEEVYGLWLDAFRESVWHPGCMYTGVCLNAICMVGYMLDEGASDVLEA